MHWKKNCIINDVFLYVPILYEPEASARTNNAIGKMIASLTIFFFMCLFFTSWKRPRGQIMHKAIGTIFGHLWDLPKLRLRTDLSRDISRITG